MYVLVCTVVPGDVLATAAMTTSSVGTPPPPRPSSSSSSSGSAVVNVMDAVDHGQQHSPRQTSPGDDGDRDSGPSWPIDRQYGDAS